MKFIGFLSTEKTLPKDPFSSCYILHGFKINQEIHFKANSPFIQSRNIYGAKHFAIQRKMRQQTHYLLVKK